MSMRVLEAILGKDVVAKLDADQVRELAEQLDAEILSDRELTTRLATVVLDAAKTLHTSN